MATEKKMKALHTRLADVLTEMLGEGETSPSFLGVVRQFLKDNNINCDGNDNPQFQKLMEAMPDLPEADEA